MHLPSPFKTGFFVLGLLISGVTGANETECKISAFLSTSGHSEIVDQDLLQRPVEQTAQTLHSTILEKPPYKLTARLTEKAEPFGTETLKKLSGEVFFEKGGKLIFRSDNISLYLKAVPYRTDVDLIQFTIQDEGFSLRFSLDCLYNGMKNPHGESESHS